MIVGEGGGGPGAGHALLWTSTDPASVIDLQGYLPSRYTGSTALGIDANGDIVGLARVGTVGPQQTGYNTAVVWLAVPEPSCLAALAVVAMAFARRPPRRRAHR
jgi:hypothetical protein